MYGRVRLSSDYSEIKIKLKFDPTSPAPNYAADWNKPPTEPMLVAIRSMDGARVPKMMKWGLIPHWSKDSKLQYSTINARGGSQDQAGVPRRLEMGPTLPRGHGRLLRMEEARSERKGKTALRDRHG
jgi:hypothetical protein